MRIRQVLGTAAAVLLLASGASAAAATPPQAAPGDAVQALVAQLSLEQKVGQLFATYVYGDSATTTNPAYTSQNQAAYGVDNGAQVIDKFHLGSVIYFTWSGNLANPTQIATLSNGLQQAATDSSGVPLLISTDQEGGNVTRIGAPVAVSPGNMAIGATFSPADSFAMSRATGQQLKALGINVDDAPVVDVNTNPANAADGPRSFGDSAGPVAVMSAASVLGYQCGRNRRAGKALPGSGQHERQHRQRHRDHRRDARAVRGQRPSTVPRRNRLGRGRDHGRAHRRALTRPVRRAGQPVQADRHRPASRHAALQRRRRHRRAERRGAAERRSRRRAVEAVEAGDDELLMPANLADAETPCWQPCNPDASPRRASTSR